MNDHNHGGLRPGVGRPSVEELRKPRSFKATDAEWQQIQANAEKAGLKISQYLRKKALE